jgi:hypothetical protein
MRPTTPRDDGSRASPTDALPEPEWTAPDRSDWTEDEVAAWQDFQEGLALLRRRVLDQRRRPSHLISTKADAA